MNTTRAQAPTLLARVARGLILAFGLAAAAAPGHCDEVAYPDRPVHLIVPFSAGAQVDVMARMIGAALATSLGQPVVVENKPGASGNIAADYVARSPADGHTLFLAGVTQTIQPNIRGPAAVDPTRAFAGVTKLVRQPILIAANASLGLDSFDALIAMARAEPGKIAYSTGGVGSTGHLAMEMLAARTGVQFLHVPYPSVNFQMRDTLSGLVQLVVNPLSASAPYVRNGQIKALAVTGAQRSPQFPETPTVAELGHAGFDVTSWYGILVPAETPRAIVDRLNRELLKVLAQPEIRADLIKRGLEIVGNPPERFDAEIKADVARWEPVVKSLGLRSEAKK